MTKPPEPVVTGELKVTPDEYLIRKGGAYYRPNAQGYTGNVAEAGRYSLEEALRHSHPNGPDGPRDGIDYMPAPARHRTANALPGNVGTVAEIKAHVERYAVRDAARRIYSTAQLETAIRLALADLTPSGGKHDDAERCNRCGHNNPSWSAPSPLWNAVIRGGSIDGEPTFSDMVCAACFMELAEQQGIASGWTVKARNVNVTLETTTPSGRVWDDDKGLWVSALSGDAGEGERLRAARNDAFLAGYEAGERGDGLDYSLDKFDVEGADHG